MTILPVINHLASNIDPQVNDTIQKLIWVFFGPVLSIAGGSAIFCMIKFGFKIHTDPENKGEHIRNIVFSTIGLMIVVASPFIVNIFYPKLLEIF